MIIQPSVCYINGAKECSKIVFYHNDLKRGMTYTNSIMRENISTFLLPTN